MWWDRTWPWAGKTLEDTILMNMKKSSEAVRLWKTDLNLLEWQEPRTLKSFGVCHGDKAMYSACSLRAHSDALASSNNLCSLFTKGERNTENIILRITICLLVFLPCGINVNELHFICPQYFDHRKVQFNHS